MRITKKYLREAKRALNHRIMYLCVKGKTGELSDEYFRCFPAAVGNISKDHNDWQKIRELLSDSLERTFPNHMTE